MLTTAERFKQKHYIPDKEEIVEILKQLDDEKLYKVYDEYCEESGSSDFLVYPMSMFDQVSELLGTPHELATTIAYAVKKGEFDIFHRYIAMRTMRDMDNYNLLVVDLYSGDSIHELFNNRCQHVYEWMANYVHRNPQSLYPESPLYRYSSIDMPLMAEVLLKEDNTNVED